MANTSNTFFTADLYNSEIHLEINEDILNNIYADGIKSNDSLKIEFVFITDSEDKAILLKDKLLDQFPSYSKVSIVETDGFFDIQGITDKVEMSLNEINNWNQTMWDFGYQYDCQLDGWQVGV
ncbi:Regulator of ribonuclease activity B [Pedobacter terrae]|uniref:Regulator of ribonuclease activity B n=1 Tax=Pedobacter terrae TaxID=405671 RepID=A0A1G7W4P6_9SPHI|nr:ribonuclease E inhibitor RraB [Pedobacter terrae]SDG66719.1 Regulator of ribonuclease activity B [Pedobacter terrae]